MPTCLPILGADDLELDPALDDGEFADLIGAVRTLLVALAGGRMVGQCELKLRPYMVEECTHWSSAMPLDQQRHAIPLGIAVTDIIAIKIDGVALDAENYGVQRLHGLKHLVRRDGEDWPTTQDVLLAATEPNTFEVTVLAGRPPDALVRNAAMELAREIQRAATQHHDCAFGPGVVTASHQGITVDYETAADQAAEAGRFPACSQFVNAYNPAQGPAGALFTPSIAGWQMVEWDD